MANATMTKLSVLVITVTTLVAIVLLLIRGAADSTITLIIAFTGPTIGTLLNLIKTEETKHMVNGRMTEALIKAEQNGKLQAILERVNKSND